MTSLIPCAVVVDSRNLVGQTARLFGSPANLSVEGLQHTLVGYGLEAVEVRVGMATRLLQEKCSQRVTRMSEKNRELADRYEREGAEVLRGYLVERAGAVEEKQVDVLCAVAVADLAERIFVQASKARCIVSVSEDMDLMPAYDFARVRDVPVFAAAVDTVHLRAEQKSWILLDEEAIADSCPSSVRYRGMKVRAWIARISLEGRQDPGLWTVGFPTGGGYYEMSRNNGARGLWDNPDGVAGGSKVMLYATGVVANASTRRFPYLQLSEFAPTTSFPGIETGRVLYWVGQTRVRLKLASGKSATVWAPAGTLLPQQEVAVLLGTDGSCNLIGELDKPSPPESWLQTPSGRSIARVTSGQVLNGWATARLEESGIEVAVALKGVTLSEHDRLAVTLFDHQDDLGIPAAHPMSTPLPAP